jgi:hypothetical protein
MIKAAWFRSYAANERPDRLDRIVQSWDTANKATELTHPNPLLRAGWVRVGDVETLQRRPQLTAGRDAAWIAAFCSTLIAP